MKPTTTVLSVLLLALATAALIAQDNEKEILGRYRAAALMGGDAGRGKVVFESKQAACAKCHVLSGKEKKAGPKLGTIGDKFTRDQLIQSVLEPSARIHPDHATTTVVTTAGKTINGVLQSRTGKEIQLLDGEGKLVRIPIGMIELEKPSKTSLMPSGLNKTVKADQFADLVAYMGTLRQKVDTARWPGMPDRMPMVKKPARLQRLHSLAMKFDHPVCIIASPTADREYFVVEQKTRRIFRLSKGEGDFSTDSKELFVDLSDEASTGQFEGVLCLAFHPRYRENRKYYVNYHVRNQGSHFSPIIAERKVTADFRRDAGGRSRRLLQIPQDTDLHWGGMLAFGPDGFLYIGAGDAGPQEDPQGNGQNLGLLTGSILRIDVDRTQGKLAYAIPPDNPFRRKAGTKRPAGQAGAREEIWAYGLRMPWRFSWDSKTGDLWVGDIGQNLFENVRIVRNGENHGWNVYEGFAEFSDRYRRKGEKYIPPVLSYRRRDGVSVTAGYVYRGKRNSSYYGAFIFADFESKRIWAMTQKDRKLIKVRQIGSCPEKPCSFGIDNNGELLVIGYEGTIYRLVLDDSVFE
ncbi:MAG: PQQ-dependent sugar dehydrogenase [Planctomycetaceae bacterium]